MAHRLNFAVTHRKACLIGLCLNGDTGLDGRHNKLKEVGWRSIIDGLEGLTSITSLNDVEGLGHLFRGGQEELDLCNKNLAENEAVVPVAMLLRRSEATLVSLDLR